MSWTSPELLGYALTHNLLYPQAARSCSDQLPLAALSATASRCPRAASGAGWGVPAPNGLPQSSLMMLNPKSKKINLPCLCASQPAHSDRAVGLQVGRRLPLPALHQDHLNSSGPPKFTQPHTPASQDAWPVPAGLQAAAYGGNSPRGLRNHPPLQSQYEHRAAPSLLPSPSASSAPGACHANLC